MSTATQTALELEQLLRLAGFSDVDHATWKQRVEKELGGASFAESLVAKLPEGLDVEPLYSAATTPALDRDLYLGRSEARGPRIAEEHEVPQPDLAAALDAGQRYGVAVPWLRVRGDSGSPADVESWRPLVQAAGAENVVLEVRGDLSVLDRADLDGPWILCSDPLGESFHRGEDDASLDGVLATPSAKVLIATSPYHDAGATAVDELSLAIAAGVEVLRGLAAQGESAIDAAARVLFAYSISDDLFLEIAKLRAARQLWWKVLAATGVEEAEVWIHARESLRGRSQQDPRTNLLRGTARCFAASVGGADSVALTPFDQGSESPSSRGRRLALLTQQVLEQEAFLGRVADPAAGSWYLESLTDRLARGGWRQFRELESHGGMVRCLRDGRVRALVEDSAARREEGKQ